MDDDSQQPTMFAPPPPEPEALSTVYNRRQRLAGSGLALWDISRRRWTPAAVSAEAAAAATTLNALERELERRLGRSVDDPPPSPAE